MARTHARLAFLVAAVAITACDTAPETAAPASDPSWAVMPAEQATDLNVVAERVGSFGGLFIDEAGRPTVYLTDMSEAPKARQILRAFAEDNGSSVNDIQFIRANFRYTDLNAWYNATWAKVMEKNGAVFSDLDEANNRILFGVENAGLATAVSAIMSAHSVPASAYAVEVTQPVVNLATLRDAVNPKIGGLQIHFTQYLCTLGFPATGGGFGDGFVTNSHCTATQGGTEGTVYYQPTSSIAPTSVGIEVLDPVYFKGGVCPRGKKCRYSDSSRAEWRNGATGDLGGIAVTNGSDLTIQSVLQLNGENDATRTPVAVGGNVTKVGRTTGTSTGPVTNTCVNTSVQGSQIMQLCQTFVSAAVGSGDSGSSVRQNNTLVGILWGGSGSTTFVFSPLRSIKDELGNFTAH